MLYYSTTQFNRYEYLFLGNALSKAGGKELRDALSLAAKTKSLTSIGDGKIQSTIFLHFHIFFFSGHY
jgi:hypothetical protein